MRNYLDKSMTYAEYVKLIDDLLIDGKTTGPNQSEAMYGYSKLNRQRMHRLEKTVEVTDSLRETLAGSTRKMIWLVITEGWCGDAAQNIPVIEKIAAASSNIETKYVLRDERPELIDMFLTRGARSIPKLIAMDASTLVVLGTWGARPAAAQELHDELKERHVEKPLIMESLQRWYNDDKSRTIQAEFANLIAEWEAVHVAGAAA